MYPLLAGLDMPTGGSETQMWTLACALVRRGHRVTVLAGQYGQPYIETFYDVEAFLLHDAPSSIKGWRPLRLTIEIWRLLRKLRPDVVIHMNFGFFHGVLGILCRALRIRYIFFTASQADVDGTRYDVYPRYVAWSWVLGMKLATTVVVQTDEHRVQLCRNFQRESVVIPNGVDLVHFRRVRNNGHDILWVGNWRVVKRPELVGELAIRLPKYRFVMCGGIIDRKLYDEVFPKLPQNVLVRGHANDSELFESYQNACVLINTSDFEGIPMTFCEAWACDLPVVSLNVDPENIISRNGLGLVSRSIEQMVKDIKGLLTEVDRVKEIGKKCRKFVNLNYNIEKIADQFEQLLVTIGKS